MSLIGILSSTLFSAGQALSSRSKESSPNGASAFEQIKTEFQQLGQDLQTGNLTQAQQDYATLSQDLPGKIQASASPASQAFAQLGKDLQAGNLQAARQDYLTVEHDAARAAGDHRHHQASELQKSSLSSQSDSVAQALGQLGQTLQAGNLLGAQSAFAILQNDLQQIGGFLAGATHGMSAPAASPRIGGLNVTA